MKNIKYLLLVLLLVLTVGCFKSNKTYNYKTTNTGEDIKVTIDSSYVLSDSEPVKITKDEKEVGSFIFITKTNFEEVKKLFEDNTLIAINQGTKNNVDYFLYKVSEDYNYITLIDGTNSGVAITCKSEETIRSIIDTIEFSK